MRQINGLSYLLGEVGDIILKYIIDGLPEDHDSGSECYTVYILQSIVKSDVVISFCNKYYCYLLQFDCNRTDLDRINTTVAVALYLTNTKNSFVSPFNVLNS